MCPFEWMTVYLIQSTPAEIKRGKKKLHSFLYVYGMLFSRPWLNIFIFYWFPAENILVLFLNL